MAAYNHHINTHHRTKRAKRIKRFSFALLALLFLGAGAVGVDWLLTNLKAEDTVVSSSSSATVQSARINIFQSPYFRFQADDNWKEVTDELNLSDGDSPQYLYRRFDKNFIEHEIWITVNLPEDYRVERHNVPTRILPVRIESDGKLAQLSSTSNSCLEVLDKKNPFLEPHVLVQHDIEYFCNPNTNDYTVAVGVPGSTTRLEMPTNSSGANGKVTMTITYRNITANPDSREFEDVLRTFKSI